MTVGSVLVLSLFTGTTSASLITDLTVANDPAVQAGVPSGSIFATVKVDAQTANSVKFTVNANESVLAPGPNFGIQKFAFDYDSSLTGSITISGLPSGWTIVEYKGLDGFGRFEIVSKGNGNSRQNPLTFTVTTSKSFSTGDDIEKAFFEENENGSHYAAHIAGFDSIGGSTSAYFTDGVPIPEVSTLLLLGSGLAGLVAMKRRARRSAARAD